MISLNPESVDFATLRKLWQGGACSLDAASLERVATSSDAVGRIVAGGATVYGINTGFGLLANTRIPADRLSELQRNLILSHSCGLGDALPRRVVRLMIILKLLGLGRGYSGVRPVVIDALQDLLDRDAMPVIPAQGSVGASGDLAPLAHLIAAMMGEGRINIGGEVLPAREALARLGQSPLELGPKEGLALINGTQASTAIALDALFMAERVFSAALGAGALSVDALKGSIRPFDPRISAVRGQPGQIRVAAAIRKLLEGSAIVASHAGDCGKVQDPYSLRCQPQVMGASLDLLLHAAGTLTIEAGAVTDNPIVFADEDNAISGGNFHAQPVAFAADIIAMAMCEVGSLSERRTAVLIDPKMSGLPAFLTDDGGVNSGLMIPQVTQAALVAENRSLAFPASVDSVPTSAGQEDHVSMAPISARKAAQIVRNVAGIVGVELIAAAQGIDYHAPLATSPRLTALHEKIRTLSPHLVSDRYWADEMAALQSAVLEGTLDNGDEALLTVTSG
ncbi:histidine ammonia-lyase [Sphingomonas xanthus]|uniref:Histidine ammonia-lyase n=1 Tax=Sphingomonas xanthus TaxID=2594473 RepID=A0A516IST0_9SPHN|nr:histidine ammonia-lyase [Sphingomonas xanthus]QDP19946.1 histidine ammonia-lyase [Sphingomonas xanthus]